MALARAKDKSLVVSVLPVPAGPAGAQPIFREGLSGSHIDSVGKGGHHQPGPVSKILIAVPEGCISNSDLAVLHALFGVVGPVELQLGLPLEGISFLDILVVQFLDDISGVGVEGDQTHDLLSLFLGQLSLHHPNEGCECFH